MRTRGSLPALALAAALASPAAAAPFTGSLTVYVFGTQQAMPAVVFGGGSGASAAGLVTVPGDAFVGTATATTPSTAPPPITGNQLVLTGHDPASFTGATLGGTMALGGALRLYAFCSPGSCAPLLEVPLSVAGSPGAKATWTGGGVSLTAIGAGWTAGNAVVTLPTSMGVVTASFAGYDGRVGGLGTLQLVTPIRVETNGLGTLLLWSSLTLTFVPEPSTALLLGAGTLALAALGRRRLAARSTR
jgi:hypothetical protein